MVALAGERVATRVAEWVAMREAKRVAPGVAEVLEKVPPIDDPRR